MGPLSMFMHSLKIKFSLSLHILKINYGDICVKDKLYVDMYNKHIMFISQSIIALLIGQHQHSFSVL